MSGSKITTQLRDAADGLAQQMNLWGHDVRHPQGNALVRFGMTRRPSPGLQGTSCYSYPWEGGAIELHGAVASWIAPAGKCGCIFCRDSRSISLWQHDQPPVPGAEYESEGDPLQCWEAFQPFLRWLLSYEQWISTHLSSAWRNRTWKTIRRLPKGKPWLPPSTALAWWHLALAGSPPRPKSLPITPLIP